jgi:cell wall-associated NlpC family hydrolase
VIGRALGCLGALALAGLTLVGLTAAAGMNYDTSSAPTGGAMEQEEADIPPVMLRAYRAAADGVGAYDDACRGMAWPILAGVAKIESGHAADRSISEAGDIEPPVLGPRLDGSGEGGNTTPVDDTDGGLWDGDSEYDRAVGPFQFLPQTFVSWGLSAAGDGQPDPHNAFDAALSAAHYLCGDGRDLTERSQLRQALFTYNHSEAYVDEVLSWIERYQQPPAADAPGGRAGRVIEAARDQLRVRYSWGGGDATGPSHGICCSPGGFSGEHISGFDCSGLTLYAYAQVGIELPHYAASQADFGRHIDRVADLRPGDLVFFAYDPAAQDTIHHVGIYLGSGEMLNAPRPSTRVRIDSVSSMPGFWGGQRLL